MYVCTYVCTYVRMCYADDGHVTKALVAQLLTLTNRHRESVKIVSHTTSTLSPNMVIIHVLYVYLGEEASSGYPLSSRRYRPGYSSNLSVYYYNISVYYLRILNWSLGLILP